MAKEFKGFIKVIFILSLTINFLLIAFFVGKRIFYANRGYFYRHGYLHPHIKPNRRWLTFLASKPDTPEIIFAGTSLTQQFQLQVAFNSTHIKNLGFAGNKTIHLLHQVQKYISRKPMKLFLEAGINDMRYGLSVDSAYGNFVKICTVVKKASPQTKLYVQATLPTNVPALNNNIQLYDNKVAAFCLHQQITYINLYPAFTRNGLIDSALTTDGIHLNETGYLLWKQQIEKYVTE